MSLLHYNRKLLGLDGNSPMKLIIAGSRSIKDYNIIRRAVFEFAKSIHNGECPLPLNKWIDCIISGNANGIDKLGEQFSKEHNISLVIFPANWPKYGNSAGFKRNSDMIAYATHLLAIWDGQSNGTQDTLKKAEDAGLKWFMYQIDGQTERNYP